MAYVTTTIKSYKDFDLQIKKEFIDKPCSRGIIRCLEMLGLKKTTTRSMVKISNTFIEKTEKGLSLVFEGKYNVTHDRNLDENIKAEWGCKIIDQKLYDVVSKSIFGDGSKYNELRERKYPGGTQPGYNELRERKYFDGRQPVKELQEVCYKKIEDKEFVKEEVAKGLARLLERRQVQESKALAIAAGNNGRVSKPK